MTERGSLLFFFFFIINRRFCLFAKMKVFFLLTGSHNHLMLHVYIPLLSFLMGRSGNTPFKVSKNYLPVQ